MSVYRKFPIQRGTPVPWPEAEKAYRTYARLYGGRQTLERLAERGGFGVQEFACLWNGHDPGTCKPICAFPEFESLTLQARVKALESENASLRNQLGDNLCWINDLEKPDAERARALPEVEFLESCRRFHGQISQGLGVFAGGKTIAQLEQELATAIADRAAVFEILTQSKMECRHPADDDSADCGEIDDCLYHSLLKLSEPLTAHPEVPAEGLLIMAHTPGPWTADATATVRSMDGWIVAEVLGGGTGKVEMHPNARLIAAAPDLLKACKLVEEFLNALEAGVPADDPLRAIRRSVHAPLKAALIPAIAKAEGKPTAHPKVLELSSQDQTTTKKDC